MGYSRASPIEDGQGGVKPEWQDSSIEQVRFKGNGKMPTFLPHIEEIVWVDKRVPAGIRKYKVISFVSSITQPIQARGRALSILSHLASRCQCGLGKRRGWIAETCLRYKLRVSRSRRKVPLDGKAGVRIGDCRMKTQTVLPSTYNCCFDGQASEKSHE